MPINIRSFRAALVAVLLLANACSDDIAPSGPPVLSVAAGDGQTAVAATELPAQIVVELRDAKQRPMSGIAVVWTPQQTGHDVVIPTALVTDGAGYARARWQLDTVAGPHSLTVTTANGVSAHVSAFANARPFSNVAELPLVTYDGSGQAVHPDFVRLPASWGGDPFRLVATPYPGGDQTYENPSLFTGSTGTSWVVPDGIQNPLERPLSGYYSDPDVMYDPDANELRIYFRRVKEENEIWLIRSRDGVIWSAPVLTVTAPNHTIVSPSVVRRGPGAWLMWSVNSGAQGCGAMSTSVELRRSADGVHWTAPEAASLADRDGFAWHIDVEWIPSRGEYWAVYPIKQPGGCVTDRLRLAVSADGVSWRTFPSPVLVKGANEQLRDIIYRSSIDYDAATGIVSIWYSGAAYVGGSAGFSWHLGWERMTLPALFARVNAPAWEAARASAVTSLPQLTNESAP